MYGHTCQAVPLVDSKEPVGGDRDDGGPRQTLLGVGSDVSHRRVRGELQHHYNILLHLLRKHHWGLQEKILFRAPMMDNTRQGRRVGRGRPERWQTARITRGRVERPQAVLARTKEREEKGQGQS